MQGGRPPQRWTWLESVRSWIWDLSAADKKSLGPFEKRIQKNYHILWKYVIMKKSWHQGWQDETAREKKGSLYEMPLLQLQ